MSDAISGRYCWVDGLRIYYEECGEGPVVLCVHTAGMESTEWRYVLPALAASGYRGLAVDLPGHGKSDMPLAGPLNAVGMFTSFLRAFAAVLSLHRPAVVGCSIGGDIALALGCEDPDFPACIVACACADETRAFSPMLLEMFREDAGSAGWNDMFRYNCLASTGTAAPPDRLFQLAWGHHRASHVVAGADLTAWNNHDIRQQVAQIACPTLLVYGAADFFVPRDRVLRTAAAIPGCRLEELPDAGHYPMVEHPRFPDLLTGFLHDVYPIEG